MCFVLCVLPNRCTEFNYVTIEIKCPIRSLHNTKSADDLTYAEQLGSFGPSQHSYIYVLFILSVVGHSRLSDLTLPPINVRCCSNSDWNGAAMQPVAMGHNRTYALQK